MLKVMNRIKYLGLQIRARQGNERRIRIHRVRFKFDLRFRPWNLPRLCLGGADGGRVSIRSLLKNDRYSKRDREPVKWTVGSTLFGGQSVLGSAAKSIYVKRHLCCKISGPVQDNPAPRANTETLLVRTAFNRLHYGKGIFRQRSCPFVRIRI